jgi:shikimate kinase
VNRNPTDATLVLIGPVAVGKSTVGPLVAERLGRAFVDLDDVAHERYYDEVDGGVARLIEHAIADGFVAASAWWQPTRVHAVRRVLADHPGAVIAFGAGHSHYEDDEHAAAVASALDGAVVVFLVPSDDVDAATELLRARCIAERGEDQDWRYPERDFLHDWVASVQNRRLSDAVVHTSTRSPIEVADAVVTAYESCVRPPSTTKISPVT